MRSKEASPYGTVSIAYHHKPTDTFSFYFDTIFRSTGIDYSFGIKLPLGMGNKT